MVHLCIFWNKAQILTLGHPLLEQGKPYKLFFSQYAEIQNLFHASEVKIQLFKLELCLYYNIHSFLLFLIEFLLLEFGLKM